MKLTQLDNQQKAKIIEINTGDISTRLIEMGFRPGEIVMLLRRAPFGGPLAFAIGASRIMLRSEEANLIHIEPVSK